MSFTRVNPGGWASNSEFTSAQSNQLDQNVANALDKTTAGDTLSGNITMASTAVIGCGYPNNINATAVASIISSIAGGIASTTVGGIVLAGGSNDEIAYASTRTVQIALPFVSLNAAGMGADSADWGTGATFGTLLGPGNPKPGQPIAIGPLPVHNGSTLTNVTVFLTVVNHTTFPAALPATLPDCQVHRYDTQTGTDITIADVGPSPSTMSNWNSTTFWSIPVTSNNVIDRSRYYYYLRIADEYGANSFAGNAYHGVSLTMGDITDARFA